MILDKLSSFYFRIVSCYITPGIKYILSWNYFLVKPNSDNKKTHKTTLMYVNAT